MNSTYELDACAFPGTRQQATTPTVCCLPSLNSNVESKQKNASKRAGIRVEGHFT